MSKTTLNRQAAKIAKAETTSQHTPGPWHSDVPCSRELTCRNIRGNNGEHVAKVGWMDFSEGQEIDLANARLIAAAPDMLEALKAVVRVADRKTDEFDRARAAIAKATGTTY